MKIEEIIVWIVVILTLILFIITAFGSKLSTGNSDSVSNSYANIPEKCRPPAGQDIESWKQHLSHHAETQDCLKYFK